MGKLSAIQVNAATSSPHQFQLVGKEQPPSAQDNELGGRTRDLRGVEQVVVGYVNGQPRTQLQLQDGLRRVPFGAALSPDEQVWPVLTLQLFCNQVLLLGTIPQCADSLPCTSTLRVTTVARTVHPDRHSCSGPSRLTTAARQTTRQVNVNPKLWVHA